MASVRKRTWRSGGKVRTAWVVDYFDQHGKRHIKTCKTKKEADAYRTEALGEVAKGVHTPTSTSITVGEACDQWLERCERNDLSRSTLYQYRMTVNRHIVPLIGREKLAKLTLPRIEAYCDELLKGVSRISARRALIALKRVLSEAQRRGFVAQNVAQPVKIHHTGARRKIGIGIDVPSDKDVRTLIDRASPSLRALVVTATLTGMRTGELRALTWENLDFEREVIVVRQAADRWGTTGRTKTAAGEREIPMSPIVVQTLREWRLACPRRGRLIGFRTPEHKVFQIAELLQSNPGITLKMVANQVGACTSAVSAVRRAMPISPSGQLWFVFPSQLGGMQASSSIWMQLKRLQRRVGMVGPDGEPKYSMHGFRHFFASWQIKQRYPLKQLQAMLGHASASMTLDIYGHLFPNLEDDHARLAAGERALLGDAGL
jgi:integrase